MYIYTYTHIFTYQRIWMRNTHHFGCWMLAFCVAVCCCVVYIHVYIYIYIDLNVYMYIHVYIFLHIHIHIQIRESGCAIHTILGARCQHLVLQYVAVWYIYTYAYMYTYIYIYIHIYIYTLIHIHMYIHIRESGCAIRTILRVVYSYIKEYICI